jgi:hypothetical protein
MGGGVEQGRARNLCTMVTAAACVMNGRAWQRNTPNVDSLDSCSMFTIAVVVSASDQGQNELRPGTEELQEGS